MGRSRSISQSPRGRGSALESGSRSEGLADAEFGAAKNQPQTGSIGREMGRLRAMQERGLHKRAIPIATVVV